MIKIRQFTRLAHLEFILNSFWIHLKFILAYALSTSGQAKQIFIIKGGGRSLRLKNQGIGGREVEIRERVFQVGLGVILETKSVEHRLVMRRGTHARGTHAKGRINNQFLITGFSMIYGVVNWRREATLPLVVANSIGQREVIKTVIDTREAWVLISRH